MGFLTHNSPVADTSRMTASIWFFSSSAASEAADEGPFLLEWGDPTNFNGLSSISVETSLDGFETINVGITSRAGKAHILSYIGPNFDNPEDSYELQVDYDLTGDGLFSFTSKTFPAGTFQDKWAHLFVSVDLSDLSFMYQTNPFGSMSPIPQPVHFSAPKCNLLLNGSNQLNLDFSMGLPLIYSIANIDTPPISSGTAFNSALAGTYQQIVGGVDPSLPAPGISGWVIGNPDPELTSMLCNLSKDDLTNVVSNTEPAVFASTAAFIQPFSTGVSGFPLGVPWTSADADSNPFVRMAEYKAWFGTYIPPSAIGLFIDAHGHPVPPAGAIEAFGTPSYHFRRGAPTRSTKFGQNQGTAGPLASIGTISDFSPGP